MNLISDIAHVIAWQRARPQSTATNEQGAANQSRHSENSLLNLWVYGLLTHRLLEGGLKMEQWIMESAFINNLISTGLLILGIFLARIFVVRAVQKWPIRNLELRRKWIVQVKNLSVLLVLFGLIFVWGTELKTFAVSLVAIAAAFVLATRELILCFLGGLMKAGSQSFSIGDRIEVSGVRGDVVDHNLLTTTLFEVGPGKEFHHFTGRIVTLPNSIFLSQPLLNETETGEYVLHMFRIPYRRADDWIEARSRLLAAAKEVCEPYFAQAKKQFARLAKAEGLEAHNIEPRVSISYIELDRIDLVLRIPVPHTAKGRVEQAILSRFAGLPESSEWAMDLVSPSLRDRHKAKTKD